MRAFQMIDPSFNMDKFLREARTYIIPEVMEAYLKGDVESLKMWCSEAVRMNGIIGVIMPYKDTNKCVCVYRLTMS